MSTDSELLQDILAAQDNPDLLVRLVREYYQDGNRSDRTSRSMMYLHLGLLCGVLSRVLEEADQLEPCEACGRPTAGFDEDGALCIDCAVVKAAKRGK